MDEKEQMAEAQAEFAINFLREVVLQKSTESLILSPSSVALALAMVYAGARGETATEIANTIAKGEEKNATKLHEYFGELITTINKAHEHYTLETANRIYVTEGFPLLESYKKVLDTHYLGQFQSVDFGNAAATAKIINDFVQKQTHDKITNLISEGNLDQLTRLVLINAIYFKGAWASTFDPKETAKKPFHIAPNNEIQVDMMQKARKEKFLYQETDEYQALGMFYKGHEIKMCIVLPKERYGLDAVLKKLSGKALSGIVNGWERADVIVSMPKFRMESSHSLVEVLKKMGVKKAFDQADFTGISKDEGLSISEVIQKAFIETNEEGSEAAAATAVIMARCCAAPVNPPPPRVFNADHPFAYFIVDSSAGSIHFAGVIRKP